MSNPLISRLCIIFGEPLSPDPGAMMAELHRLTSGYSQAEQDKAADFLIRTHNPTARKPWPAPAEIIEACNDARAVIVGKTPQTDDEKRIEWSKEAVAKAWDLMRSDIGRKAADDGWSSALWDFCRKNRRLPDEGEIAKCKANAASFNEAYGMLGKGKLDDMLRKLFETRMAFRNRLSEHAWGVDTSRPGTSAITKRMTGEHNDHA